MGTGYHGNWDHVDKPTSAVVFAVAFSQMDSSQMNVAASASSQLL